MNKIVKLIVLLLVCLITIFYFTNKNNPLNTQNNFNIIILGLDPRNDTLEKTETTDTIIFASFNLRRAELNLISLPRDLWNYATNSKINQIYPDNIDDFGKIQLEFASITGQTIHRTIIITTQNLIDLVDLIGGVDVYLEQGFKDEKYPNPDYIKNPSPKISPYKTVEFPSGWIHLDKTNVAEFVRSRHADSDLARIQRQQLLIEAIFKKMTQPQYLSKLNYFYRHNLKTNLNYNDIVNLILNLKFKILNPTSQAGLKLNKIDLPIGSKAGEGVIYYPNKLTRNQWAFLPSDPDYQALKEFIDKAIK
ncbi:MAG TPA: LCP family protein [Candidatus Woesebacteria bacterium]|nr:LCP family protein [Candidatus Woesebacteria bacterium]